MNACTVDFLVGINSLIHLFVSKFNFSFVHKLHTFVPNDLVRLTIFLFHSILNLDKTFSFVGLGMFINLEKYY